jgi:hypothetical protein
LQWHGKEPSWRRIGRRFVADVATKHAPSYWVEILGQEASPFVITLYWVKLSQSMQEWWYRNHSEKLQPNFETAKMAPNAYVQEL